MSCLDESTVTALVERRLPPSSMAPVSAHADSCASCRRLIAAATRALLGSAPDGRADATTSTLPRAAMNGKGAVAFGTGDCIGRYRVLEVLGAGGMGVVYGAFDPELQRKVALKLVRAEFAELDIELRARLVREAQAMARIRHPNVITIFDVGTFDDRLFVAMEIIDGSTLTAWQAARTRSVDEILRVFAAAGAGLAAAHHVGLVHRDFKPDNILIGHDGGVSVMDFGLARPVAALPSDVEEPSSPDATLAIEGELTHAGAVVGTPAYMAPEQMRGEPPDGRADQFSFCVALFEALYGVRPFPGKALGELERAILDGQRLRPRRKGVPAAVRRVLARGLSGDSASRFSSMTELLAALTPSRRAARGWAAAALVAVAAVAGVAAAAHWRGDRTRMCRGAADKLVGVWDGARRAAVASTLGADPAGGQDRAARVVAALDDYAGRWVRAYTDACEATHVRGEQSEALLDLRMQCLDERRKVAEELTHILASDRDLGDKAPQAVQSLPSLAQCADTAALERPRAAPAAARGSLEAPRQAAARARAELAASKCSDALAHASQAAQQARVLDASALAASATLLVARAQRCLGELATTRTTLIDGAVLAARAQDEPTLTLIAAQAVQLDAQLSDFADADHWAALAEDAAAHSGGDAHAEADRLYALGILEWRRDHLAAAVALHRRAQPLYDRIEGGDYDRLRNLGQLASILGAMGRFTEARPLQLQLSESFVRMLGPDNYMSLSVDENVALEDWEQGDLASAMAGEHRFLERVRQPSPSHLSTAQANYGWMLIDAGRAREATTWLERGLATARKIDGDSEETEFALAGIGAALVARGEPRLALAPLQQALALQTEDATAAERADTQLALARALSQLGRDRSRALSLARQARDYYTKHPLGARRARQLADAQQWLRTHEESR